MIKRICSLALTSPHWSSSRGRGTGFAGARPIGASSKLVPQLARLKEAGADVIILVVNATPGPK